MWPWSCRSRTERILTTLTKTIKTMNIMKVLRFLFLVMAGCLTNSVMAQIHTSGIMVYVYENANMSDPQTSLTIFRFVDDRCYSTSTIHKLKEVSDGLRSNSNYLETLKFPMIINPFSSIKTYYSYDDKMSNGKWYVYSDFNNAWNDTYNGEYHPAYTSYVAFKYDYSQCMKWYEPQYDNGPRRTYKRLSISELKKMKFTASRDFLR